MSDYYVHTRELCFADWLIEIMTDNKIKGSQLARAISTEERTVNRSTISLWRSGDRLPSCGLRVKLAEHLSSLGIDGYNAMIKEILWRVHVSEWRAQ